MTVLIILGAVIGHFLRRITPRVMGMKQRSLPFRFPWPELAGAVVFPLVGWVRGVELMEWPYFLFVSLLLLISTTDFLTKYISYQICLGGAIAGVLSAAIFPGSILDFPGQGKIPGWFGILWDDAVTASAVVAVLGAVTGFLQMELISRIFRPLVNFDVLGRGDALLMMMAGAFLGPNMVLFALFPGCLIGLLMGTIWKLVHGTPHFPFGPALAMGSLVMLLWSDRVLASITAFHQGLYQLPPAALLLFSLALVGVLVFLIFRLKRKSADYEQMIEDDYRNIDEGLE